MSEAVWDAAVIGGGPAGSSTAITMARRGLRVIQFEAKTYPHDKLCGEFLSPECAGLLAGLGMEQHLIELKPVPIQTASITASDGTAWETSLPGTALGLSRKTLDAALAEQARQAGVVVREAETVNYVEGDLEYGFRLETAGQKHRATIHARAVIAAHGKRSSIDRVLRRGFIKKRQPFLAIKAHFHGPPIPRRIELHTFPGGYCGMSEIENGEKVVCLLVQESVFQANGGRGPEGIERFIAWMMAQNIYLRSWLQWADRIHEHWITIAQIPFLQKQALECDVIMAGDSAGLIAPLAGNGISMALEGGMMAANYMARYLAGEILAEDLRAGYPRTWQKRFGARLRLGRLLQPFMLQPRMISLALKLFEKFPRAGSYLVEHTRSNTVEGGGKTSY